MDARTTTNGPVAGRKGPARLWGSFSAPDADGASTSALWLLGTLPGGQGVPTPSWVTRTVLLPTRDRLYEPLCTSCSHLQAVLPCLIFCTGHVTENSPGALGGPEFLRTFL